MTDNSISPPRLWGESVDDLHDAFWRSCRTVVVRPDDPTPVGRRADLYLLIARTRWVWFDLTPVAETLRWMKPQVLHLRVRKRNPQGYAERVVKDAAGRFERIERQYIHATEASCRVTLTRNRTLAEAWRTAGGDTAGGAALRYRVARAETASVDIDGRFFGALQGGDYLSVLARRWRDPHDAIWDVTRLGERVFAGAGCDIPESARLVGPLWIGRGQRIAEDAVLIGPQVLPDRPTEGRNDGGEIRPLKTKAVQVMSASPRGAARSGYWLKRPLDVVFASAALLVTLPAWPVIMLAVLAEDGGPPFFVHRRQSKGGRPFGCIKFRSMRRGADGVKEAMQPDNQADGPQFYIENDPRITRVGGFLRRFYLDEMPQLLNVLKGDMSLVGPRPSPEKENQFCPAWRDARLSVRPGLTGMWQVCRTRAAGQDFLEWIRYDLEYVETRSLRLDTLIVLKTIARLLRRKKSETR